MRLWHGLCGGEGSSTRELAFTQLIHHKHYTMNITQVYLSLSVISFLNLPTLHAGTMALGKSTPAAALGPSPANNPLSFADGKLIFDVQEKVRIEARSNNFDFNSGATAPTDDEWLLQRFRLGLKYKPTQWLTFYAQGQDVREIDSDRPNVIGQMGAEGDDAFDLLEGWVELGDPKNFTFKLGRQKLNYGDQRMVGPLEWLNPSRAFDGAKLRMTRSTWSMDLFAASVVPFTDGAFNESDLLSGAAREQLFSGAYFSSTGLPFQKTDLYLFHLAENTPTGDTSFFTLGTLWKGLPAKLNNWDYTVEAMLQFGEVKGKDLSAYATHVDAGYTFANSSWKPRVGLEYNIGSGDANPTDGEVQTFQNLFPTNHLFYGSMDLFSLQNIHNIGLNVSAQPTKKLKLTADYHGFWLAETNDQWYRANGVATVRTPQPGASSAVGTELDLSFTYKFNPNFALHGGYSRFFGGDWLKSGGASSDANFFWLQAQVDF